MNLMIPSTDKDTILAESVPSKISEWQPSDVMCAALICRLHEWPLWTPISERRVTEFRSRVLKTATDRWTQKCAKTKPEMPNGLTRSEQHAVRKLGALIEPEALPSCSLAARLLVDDFWSSIEWDSMQRDVIPHYGIFVVSPHLIIGRSLAYADRKIGKMPPMFCEGSRTTALNPLHVIAINSGSPDDAVAWHARLREIYDNRLATGSLSKKIPPQVLVLRVALTELESIAQQALDIAAESATMLDAVCCESSLPPLGILRTTIDKTPDQLAPSNESPAPAQQLAPLPRLELTPPVESTRADDE